MFRNCLSSLPLSLYRYFTRSHSRFRSHALFYAVGSPRYALFFWFDRSSRNPRFAGNNFDSLQSQSNASWTIQYPPVQLWQKFFRLVGRLYRNATARCIESWKWFCIVLERYRWFSGLVVGWHYEMFYTFPFPQRINRSKMSRFRRICGTFPLDASPLSFRKSVYFICRRLRRRFGRITSTMTS